MASTVFSTALLVGAAAAPAHAASSGAAACQTASWKSVDGTETRLTQSATLHQRGPYSDCTPGYSLTPGTRVVYDCFTSNSYENTWTHVTAYYSNLVLKGWIWDAKLPGGGSYVECPW
ncbi:SH3 domain-containing protein [Streptomyces sp. NPDC056909]|uniref:SH3 domain-containing protein n=1 Tax=Streptomyces sp. NPDC056909 TaxID=3345963 RepID=UPI0036863243